MRFGITTATGILVMASLTACGQASEGQQAPDSIAMADGSRAFNNFGPEWQADTNLARLMPSGADVYVPPDDGIVRPPVAPPSCPEGTTVHFDSPEAAMTYLAAAWNRDDLAALCQVTNPNARFELDQMHREAVNLRLKECGKVQIGQYSCTFIHDYPKHVHKKGTGRAWFDVGAADNPGWYMTVYEGCG